MLFSDDYVNCMGKIKNHMTYLGHCWLLLTLSMRVYSTARSLQSYFNKQEKLKISSLK